MGIELGEPVYLGYQPADGVEPGDIYSVGAVERGSNGRLLATGTVIVVVLNDGDYDPAQMKRLAKGKAAAMIAADPSLLTPVHVPPPGGHHPKGDDGTSPPWAGDGFLDPPDDDGSTDEPKRILSPDSPATGG